MIEILEELHKKYLPIDAFETVNGEEVSVLEKILFGGDQLTYERGQNCIDSRSDGDSEYERLEGFISKVEDWHAIRILYQVCRHADMSLPLKYWF
jgi:HD superfamily phosphohydrolase YqeK